MYRKRLGNSIKFQQCAYILYIYKSTGNQGLYFQDALYQAVQLRGNFCHSYDYLRSFHACAALFVRNMSDPKHVKEQKAMYDKNLIRLYEG